MAQGAAFVLSPVFGPVPVSGSAVGAGVAVAPGVPVGAGVVVASGEAVGAGVVVASGEEVGAGEVLGVVVPVAGISTAAFA